MEEQEKTGVEQPETDYKALYEKLQRDKENLENYAKDLKSKYKAKLSDEEKRNAELAEKEAHYKALERELFVSKIKSRLSNRIPDEALLEKLSTSFADGNIVEAIESLNKYESGREAEIKKQIRQELLSDNPTPPPQQAEVKDWKKMSAMDWETLKKESPEEYKKMLDTIK